jgi:hypothetical protein
LYRLNYPGFVTTTRDSIYNFLGNFSGLLAAAGGSSRSGVGAGGAATGSEESSRGETCIVTFLDPSRIKGTYLV